MMTIVRAMNQLQINFADSIVSSIFTGGIAKDSSSIYVLFQDDARLFFSMASAADEGMLTYDLAQVNT